MLFFLDAMKEGVVMERNNNNLKVNEILVRLFLKKLGYEKEIINKVCEVIRLS